MVERRTADRWGSGAPYERYVGRWSRRVAPLFLRWLDIPVGRRWLDVGCGTGALSAAILDHASPASVTAVDPSTGFVAAASEGLGDRVRTMVGSAEDLPLESASVDVAVSGLVLNFTGDAVSALTEQARVTTKGGTVAAYVWDYAEGMELMRLFWDAAVQIDPGAAQLDEGSRFPICRPEALAAAFRDGGLAEVDVAPIDIDTRFTDIEDLWAPFLGGQGPAPSYLASLDESARAALHDRIRVLAPAEADGSIALRARAWAVRGTRRR